MPVKITLGPKEAKPEPTVYDPSVFEMQSLKIGPNDLDLAALAPPLASLIQPHLPVATAGPVGPPELSAPSYHDLKTKKLYNPDINHAYVAVHTTTGVTCYMTLKELAKELAKAIGNML